MTLPVIVMLERHWDVDAKETLEKMLPSLFAQGYNVLSFESPSDESEEELISGIKSTIKFLKDRHQEAIVLLKRRGIDVDLFEMNYPDLVRLLLNYVSSRHSNEMALWFKELPGHEKKLTLVDVAKSMNMAVLGVDLVTLESESLRSMDAQAHFSKKLSAIDLLDDKRIASFKKNVLNLQQMGKGVIFVVGQFHYERLFQEFSQDSSISDVIFIHPYSPKCLDKSLDDRPLVPIKDNMALTLIDREIRNYEDIAGFAESLNKTIQSKVDSYKQINDTTVSKILIEKIGLPFDFYLRPTMHLDAYCPLEKGGDISATAKRLNEAGIGGAFTFFKGVPSYCIPCLNSGAVSDAIIRL